MGFKEFWTSLTVTGMYLPFAQDPVKQKPSVTLLFFYIGNATASLATIVSSTILIVKEQYLLATVSPMMLYVLGFVFYRLRNLDHVKIDLDDQSIELDASNKGKK